jgi:glycerophosphoryl diester phosphodiesterase
MICIAHRGAKGYAPENTLGSLAKAMEMRAGWVEVDVYYVDHHLVVIHDETLERTTNGKGFLRDKSFAYLRSLDAGDGEKIPTLEEVLDLTWKKAGINIELKGTGTSRPLVELLRKKITPEWGLENFLVSSFNHQILYEIRKLDADVRIGLLLQGKPENYQKTAEDLKAYSINLNIFFVKKEIVMDAHSHGLKVFVYTANKPHDIKRVKAMGVDGIFTDYPDRVLKLMQEEKE